MDTDRASAFGLSLRLDRVCPLWILRIRTSIRRCIASALLASDESSIVHLGHLKIGRFHWQQAKPWKLEIYICLRFCSSDCGKLAWINNGWFGHIVSAWIFGNSPLRLYS